MKDKKQSEARIIKIKRAMALTQISILMLEIFAFAFLFSLVFSVGSVSAVDPTPTFNTKLTFETPNLAGSWGRALPGTAPGATSLGTYQGFNYDTGLYANKQSVSVMGTELFGSSSPYWGSLTQGLQWAGYVGMIMGLATMLMPEKQKMIQAAGTAIIAGIMVGELVKGAAMDSLAGSSSPILGGLVGQGTGSAAGIMSPASLGIGVGIIVAYFVFAALNKTLKTKNKTIEFQCLPWQAPLGGDDCNKCNGNPQQPCSEYRCKALGQTCKLVNAGTGQDRCIDSSPNDVTSPGIKPWQSALTLGYKYTKVQERPPGESSKVPGQMTIIDPATKDGCLKAFTPFEFGIVTTDTGDVSQPAQCKIDYNHTKDFNSMSFWLAGNNIFMENHSQVMSLPGVDLLKTLYKEANGTLAISNDGEYTFYIRCMDGNGNQNRDEFAVRFCIDKGPDVTAPVVKATSIPTGSPILYKADNVSLQVYTNEPANCKWSRKDTEYSNMENTMQCTNRVWEMNAEALYTCKTTLTSIKDKESNQFYFRCEDLSDRKNQMQQSYAFELRGSQPLTILSVSPNGTIGSSTSTAQINLEVKTDNGESNGKAKCLYSLNNQSLIEMFETNSNIHRQTLDLTTGEYTVSFKCIDLGGNTAFNSTKFSVFVDKYSPAIVRTYSLENKILIVTDEDSQCKYSTTSCNFDLSKEGIIMPDASSTDQRTHYTEWQSNQIYYVKCSDIFNNQPDPTQCSMVIKQYLKKTE